MQALMVKSGTRYRKATAAEVAEVAGYYARVEFNRQRPLLDNPENAVAALRGIYAGRDYEAFSVLFLDRRHQLLECVELFRGTIDGASVYPREVLKECLWRGSAAVVIAHNHPSGTNEPSNADVLITKRLQDALAMIDVRLVDHLIIGATGRWCSLAQLGMV